MDGWLGGALNDVMWGMGRAVEGDVSDPGGHLIFASTSATSSRNVSNKESHPGLLMTYLQIYSPVMHF